MSTTTESGPQYVTPQYVALPDIAEALGIIVTRVHQLVRDRQLIAVRIDGALRIPAEFVQDGLVVKGLPGTITVLTDAGYSDAGDHRLAVPGGRLAAREPDRRAAGQPEQGSAPPGPDRGVLTAKERGGQRPRAVAAPPASRSARRASSGSAGQRREAVGHQRGDVVLEIGRGP